MNTPMPKLIAAICATALFGALPTFADTKAPDEPATASQPTDANEPSIDELLGLDESKPADAPDAPQDDANPKLTRDLDKALTGQQAADQFAQAIQEMEEVAIRLSEESDPGIDTQRMQDEIILKLEQIIASAEKAQSERDPQPGQGQPQPGEAREADRPGEQPGEQQGEQPGEGQGDKPGQENEPGQQPGVEQGEQGGEQQGQQGDQAGGQQSGQAGSQGTVRNEELSMKDLREGEWGNLPPRLRDELAESLSETFNPVYRAATEAFYRRIAEMSQEQAGGGE